MLPLSPVPVIGDAFWVLIGLSPLSNLLTKAGYDASGGIAPPNRFFEIPGLDNRGLFTHPTLPVPGRTVT